MNDQLSQAYDIDNRRAGTYTRKPGQPIQAEDNEAAKDFLAEFVEAKRDKAKPDMTAETASEGRFDFGYDGTFRNLFRAR